MDSRQITITIDGKQIVTEAGKTIYQAAKEAGIEIPVLCYNKKCKPNTTCMVCLVKIHGRAGFAPSCATEVTHEMRIDSETEEVIHLRRKALELLLSEHLGDCLGPCQVACPADLDIPNMLRAISAGDMPRAAEIVRQTIPIPGILAAICPAPCEKICRHKQTGRSIPICELKGDVGYYIINNMAVPKPAASTGKSVSIVGAGPAGLSAAWHLTLAGHKATVFDKQAEPGGGLLQIESEKLPADILKAETAMPFEMGAEYSQSELGKDLTLTELTGKYDAVLLATGPKSDEFFVQWGLVTGESEKPVIDKLALQVSVNEEFKNVFTAGGINQAGRMAVRAVGQGRYAAVSICQFLAGVPVTGEPKPFNTRIGKFTEDELFRIARLRDMLDSKSEKSSEKPTAADCLHCDCRDVDNCKLRKYSSLLDASPTAYKHSQRKEYTIEYAGSNRLIYEPGKCIKCGICVQISANFNPDKALTFSCRGYDTRVVAPLGMDLGELPAELAADLAESCPTGALSISE